MSAHLSALVSVTLAFKFKISRPQVLTLFSSGRRRQRARPRSLCASYRMLQTTQPRSRAAQHIRRPTHDKLVRSRFARNSFTHGHAAGWRVARPHLCFDGQAVNGYVLAARAQEPSVGTADRWPATWRVQIQAVREAVARSVSPRCAAVPTDASGSVRSALKATSEVGTGGPATRVIEADVPPTSPGHADACGALGEL